MALPEMISLPSTFGGASIYWGVLWVVDSSAGCLSSGENSVYYRL